MKNVLFVINGNDKGGVLSWLIDLSKGLKEKNVKLFYSVSCKGESYNQLQHFGHFFLLPEEPQPFKPKFILGIPIYSFLTYFANKKKNNINSKKLSQIVYDNSIRNVICIGFNSIPVLTTNKFKSRVISVIHTVPRNDNTPFKIKSKVIGRKLSKADEIVTVGNTVVSKIETSIAKKIKIIPNSSIDFLEYAPNRNSIRKKLRIPLDAFCMGTLGRFTKFKGFLEIVKIFEKLAGKHPKLYCVLGGYPVGDTDKAYFNEVKLYSSKSRYSNRIHIFGKIDNKKFYPIIDVFLLLSLYGWEESFGLVIVEAMSMGIPVISSNIGGPLDIITHNKDGLLVENNSLDQFEKLLDKLINDHDKWNNLSTESRLTYLNVYNKKKWINKWYNFLFQ